MSHPFCSLPDEVSAGEHAEPGRRVKGCWTGRQELMRRSTALSSSLLVLLPLVACGSRVPHDAVVRANGAGAGAVQGPSTPTGTAAPNAAFTAPGGTSNAGNTASSVGVTAGQINVGVLSSKSSPLGPEVFSGSYYGATAYWDAVNRAGGIHGRKIKVFTCDDGGSGTGNVACVHKLVDSDHVFALAGTTVFQYDGAKYLNSAGVDDVGGQPIGNEYDTYHHLWSIYGSDEPRNGTVGWNGKLYSTTEVYRWFAKNRGTKHAAVVFYNVAQSQRYAKSIEAGLKAEGYTVREEQVDLGLANFDSVAVDMASRHVDSVFDALDQSGNVRLCRAMDAHHVKVIAKVTTTQSWVQTVKTDFGQSPTCRNDIYATGSSENYADTGIPAVAQFRDAMAQTYPQREGLLSQWGLEGWAGAQWLADAMGSCGAALTRACIENYLTTIDNYTGHGLLTSRNFKVIPPKPTATSCLNVARWQDSADGGKGGWVTQVKDMNTNCFTTPNLAYSP